MNQKMKNFNSYLGDKLAFGLSTMTAFYIVTAFVLIPLLFQTPHDLVGWIQYVVQSLFQGAALPILAYVAKLEGAKTERVLTETHDLAMKELSVLKKEQKQAKIQRTNSDVQRTELNTKLDSIISMLNNK